MSIIQIVINVLIGFLSAAFGFCLSPQIVRADFDFVNHENILKWILVAGVLLGLASYINGHDAKMMRRSRVDYLINLFVSSSVGCSIASVMLYLLTYNMVGRWVVVITLMSYCLLGLFATFLFSRGVHASTLVIGENLKRFEWYLSELGLSKIKVLYDIIESKTAGASTEIIRYARKNTRRIYIVPGDFCSRDILLNVNNNKNDLSKFYFSIEELLERELEIVDFESLLETRWWAFPTELRVGAFASAKRIVDIIIAVVLMFLSVPIVGFVALYIKTVDGGPVFYRQTRLGQYGQRFQIIKIRTMRVDAEKDGPVWAKVHDSRVTRIGSILRSTRIDEIPQLWNIICGQMSFIGPRPERPEFHSRIAAEVPQFSLRLACKPGLSGWAQVNFPYGASISDAKMKLCYDLYYIKHANVLLDLRVAMRTVIAMVKGAR